MSERSGTARLAVFIIFVLLSLFPLYNSLVASGNHDVNGFVAWGVVGVALWVVGLVIALKI